MKFTERNGLNLFEVNEDVLSKWDKQDLFHKSMSEREGCPSFVFFEGPPSANGHPGIHHVMARTIKDVFCRYKTMQGFQVKRKAGWDTHGLRVSKAEWYSPYKGDLFYKVVRATTKAFRCMSFRK